MTASPLKVGLTLDALRPLACAVRTLSLRTVRRSKWSTGKLHAALPPAARLRRPHAVATDRSSLEMVHRVAIPPVRA